jgi:hypothetical protein
MPVPPDYIQTAAQRALDVRKTLPPSRRAGTDVGIARARDLARGADLSRRTISRMHSYLSRTEKAYQDARAAGKDIKTSKQILATGLWGGPRALAWVRKQLQK